MKRILSTMVATLVVVLFSICDARGQIRYTSNGKMTIGNTDPFAFYHYTVAGTGVYFKFPGSYNNFFQIDVTPAAPRLAGHGNQVVFYNTQTSTFNSIQVHKVFNYSDARAKSSITPLLRGMDIIKRLRPVTYNFTGNEAASFKTVYNEYTKNNREIGLLAQDVEAILPNLVYTDSEGRKLVDYTSLIPVLIDAVKTLQKEVEILKKQK